MLRIVPVIALILSLSLVGVNDLLAQRRGFIIGFGLGAGVTSYTDSELDYPDSDRQTKVGLATDFKIGAQVSPSVQVYYLGRVNWFRTATPRIAALGVTYVLPSAPVHLSGGIGVATWNGLTGFGLTGGVGWEFADLWLLDFAITYGRPGDSEEHVNMFLVRAGVSILSH